MSKSKRDTPPSILPLSGGVTMARGFSAGGIKAGIKTTGKEDLALLVSDRNCSAAGTFTTNAIRASSVDWCERLLPGSAIRAVVCNSGCANACTGSSGEKDTVSVARTAARELSIAADAVLCASTGVIGRFLPMKKIVAGIGRLAHRLSPRGGTNFARAIMTT
ncbi:MAG: bifunctional ornithine acetyltransferase/N-acetylglutamate synthase, partial [Chitinispirillaceae bacterium]|nr:bifunctional ornithine acetyltransferase/N-acetylglutamate synthase [Chitinispirillaceae bacterium]